MCATERRGGERYIGASEFEQRRGRQIFLRDLIGIKDFEELSPAEQRENLVRVRKQLDIQLAAEPKKSERRKEIGLQMQEINRAINELRPKMKGGREVRDHFIDAARSLLTRHQYQMIMDEASRRCKAGLEADPMPVTERIMLAIAK